MSRERILFICINTFDIDIAIINNYWIFPKKQKNIITCIINIGGN